MRMDAIGYKHVHDAQFVIDRPEGSHDWLLLVVHTKSFFDIDGKILHIPANSVMIYAIDYPLHYGADGG